MVPITITLLVIEGLVVPYRLQHEVRGIFHLIQDIRDAVRFALLPLPRVVIRIDVTVVILRVEVRITLREGCISQQQHVGGEIEGLAEEHIVSTVEPSARQIIITVGVIEERLPLHEFTAVELDVLAHFAWHMSRNEPIHTLTHSLCPVKPCCHPQRLLILFLFEC